MAKSWHQPIKRAVGLERNRLEQGASRESRRKAGAIEGRRNKDRSEVEKASRDGEGSQVRGQKGDQMKRELERVGGKRVGGMTGSCPLPRKLLGRAKLKEGNLPLKRSSDRCLKGPPIVWKLSPWLPPPKGEEDLGIRAVNLSNWKLSFLATCLHLPVVQLLQVNFT